MVATFPPRGSKSQDGVRDASPHFRQPRAAFPAPRASSWHRRDPRSRAPARHGTATPGTGSVDVDERRPRVVQGTCQRGVHVRARAHLPEVVPALVGKVVCPDRDQSAPSDDRRNAIGNGKSGTRLGVHENRDRGPTNPAGTRQFVGAEQHSFARAGEGQAMTAGQPLSSVATKWRSLLPLSSKSVARKSSAVSVGIGTQRKVFMSDLLSRPPWSGVFVHALRFLLPHSLPGRGPPGAPPPPGPPLSGTSRDRARPGTGPVPQDPRCRPAREHRVLPWQHACQAKFRAGCPGRPMGARGGVLPGWRRVSRQSFPVHGASSDGSWTASRPGEPARRRSFEPKRRLDAAF